MDLYRFKLINLIALSVVASTILLNCRGEETIQIPENNLSLRFSFGHEGEVLLMAPPFMATDRRNSIFISEHMHHKVIEFSLEGEFRQEIGRMGAGAREFVTPQQLDIDGEWLYVQDMGNRRLVLFNLTDSRSEIIRQNSHISDLNVYQGKIFGFDPVSGLRMVSELGEEFIRVYDSEWELVREFGEFLTMEEDIAARFNEPMIEIEADIIHTVFIYFPVYRAYSTNGELLKELNLSELLHLDRPAGNYNESLYRDAFSTDVGPIFRAMDFFNNRLFVARQGRTIVIDEYHFDDSDFSLTYQNTWSFDEVSEEYFIINFFYHENSNSFYILEYNEVPMITVYQLLDDV